MDYSQLERLIGVAPIPPVLMADSDHEVLRYLESSCSDIILVSGELHPSLYNNKAIAHCVTEILRSGNRGILACWGPVTFLDADGYNPLYYLFVNAPTNPKVSVLHSLHRQQCHFWNFADTILYHRPYGYSATLSQRSTYRAQRSGIDKAILSSMEEELTAGDVVPVSLNTAKETFRLLRVLIDSRGAVRRYLNPARPEAPRNYYCTLISQLPDSLAIHFREEEDNHLRVDLFVSETIVPQVSKKKIQQYNCWTADRFPEFHLTFCTYTIRPEALRYLRDQKGVITVSRTVE